MLSPSSKQMLIHLVKVNSTFILEVSTRQVCTNLVVNQKEQHTLAALPMLPVILESIIR